MGFRAKTSVRHKANSKMTKQKIMEYMDNVRDCGTEEEVAEFFHHEYGGCPCPLDNPLLWDEEAEYNIVEHNIEIE